jgi:hypothetical protein
MLSSIEFDRLKNCQNTYAKLYFEDGEITIAKIVSLTTDMDGTWHLVYDDIRETNIWEAYEATDEIFSSPTERISSFEIIEMD